MIKSTLKRFTAVLVLLLTVSIVFAIVPDPKTKKKVTTTTATTTQKKPAVTTQKKQASTTQKKSSSSSRSSATTQNSSVMTIYVGNVSFRMVRVEGGTFTLGTTSGQSSDAWDDEPPAHSVTLSTYYIGETEVTQELWQEVMGSNPSHFKGSRRPVEMVSWEECQDFIRRLNQRTGKNFRLPTEAEWEYAARGGKKSYGYKFAGGNNLNDVAWYGSEDTHKVGLKRANELGLYDMSGNVYEWCQDWYYKTYPSSSQTNPTGPLSGSCRVVRGGRWGYLNGDYRVKSRSNCAPSLRSRCLGLRLVLFIDWSRTISI